MVDIMVAGMAVDIMAAGITDIMAAGITDIIAAGVHASMSAARPIMVVATSAGGFRRHGARAGAQ
ncbi:hypothetical protein ASC80_08150 [Afipia sp. Root123D2]|nr:hypothetical protein ASC80_08150 [Afipia sp. Root123D2]